MNFWVIYERKTEIITGEKVLGKKTFLWRKILDIKNAALFCILKQMGLFLYEFPNFPFAWFFDLCIFYTNLKFSVRKV